MNMLEDSMMLATFYLILIQVYVLRLLFRRNAHVIRVIAQIVVIVLLYYIICDAAFSSFFVRH